ncbi:MAG: prolipoprotein diacylglyceryl transferase [Oscillospiraceae bacterium]|nr:prolipoprotein diacylglyceryl transferase [Oscillospiraceae bacterium]
MHPYFNFFGREIPAFGLMMIVGAAVALLAVYFNCRLKKIDATDSMLTAIMAALGGAFGVVALKPIIKIPEVIMNWERFSKVPLGDFLAWFFGEMVFYGGLLGGAAAAFIFCRGFKMSFLKTADILIPAVPLGHAFGRIGCLLGGCCYGVEVSASHPFAIVYPERTDGLEAVTAPIGIPVLAVPVIEAGGNIIIAVIIMLFGLKLAKTGQCLALYGLLYGVQRFVLEFFRGDLHRGVYNGISTSQIISIGIVAISAMIFILPYLPYFKNKHKTVDKLI